MKEKDADGNSIVRILFKIPNAAAKSNSFSLPLNTTVLALASYAASVVRKE